MIKWIALFILGGILFLALRPLLAGLAAILLLLALLALLAAFILPGGWVLTWLGFRSTGAILSSRVARAVLLLPLAALLSIFLDAVAPGLGLAAGFAVCGLILAGLPVSPPRRGAPASRTMPAVKASGGRVEVELGSSRLLGSEGLTSEDLRAGVLVTGDESVEAARALISGLCSRGRRVIVVGSSSLIIPSGFRVRGARAERIDVAEDLVELGSVEEFTYSLALANRLRNDDIPLILMALDSLLLEVRQGKREPGEILQAVPENIQDRRSRVIQAVISNNREFLGCGGLSLKDVGDGWQILYISFRGLGHRQATFTIAYTLLMLRNLDAFLVIHEPELLVKDVNLLAYDSREPWEHVFNALAEWREKGLALVSRSPLLSPWVYQLCQTHIATRFGEYVSRPMDQRAAQVLELARGLKPGEAVISGSRGIKTVRLRRVEPANIRPPKAPEPPREKAAQERPLTALEREFGEKAGEAAGILAEAKKGLRAEQLKAFSQEVAGKLKELGYIRDDILAGHILLTEPGEQALKEYQEAAKAGIPAAPKQAASPVGEERAEPGSGKGGQEILDRGEAAERADEHLPLLMRAESLYRQGKYELSLLTAYEYMVQALKSAYRIEKGHLPDIVGRLRGLDVGITPEEAKTAKTLLIEARKALEEGGRVPVTDAAKILNMARRVRGALGGDGLRLREVEG